MKSSVIYSSPIEVGSKLSVFEVALKSLQEVAMIAASARNQASPLHPVNAPGTFSYMEGVAALRMVFLQQNGWEKARPNGSEAIENKRLGIIILFQNVDHACGAHDPNPISGKGEGVAKIVDNPTGYLWKHMEQEDASKENSHVWFFCVSCNGEEVKAELSRPREIKSGNFGTFAERIFILQNNDWSPKGNADDSENIDDEFEINVTKKPKTQ